MFPHISLASPRKQLYRSLVRNPGRTCNRPIILLVLTTVEVSVRIRLLSTWICLFLPSNSLSLWGMGPLLHLPRWVWSDLPLPLRWSLRLTRPASESRILLCLLLASDTLPRYLLSLLCLCLPPRKCRLPLSKATRQPWRRCLPPNWIRSNSTVLETSNTTIENIF